MRVVAAVERKRVDAVAVYDLAEFGRFGFELRLLSRDRHGLGRHARFQFQVHAEAILNVDLHRASHCLLESLFLDRDTVTANPERARDILSTSVGGKVISMPRSTSVTVTLAPVTTAPLGSRTTPTMAPASFCAQRGAASTSTIAASIKEENKAERVCRRGQRMDMTWLLITKPEGGKLERSQASLFWARRKFGYWNC